MTSETPRWFPGLHNKKANECMCHRYLYYCLSNPIISDEEYDFLEKKALEECDPDHPLHLVGYSWAGSYHRMTRWVATEMLKEQKDEEDA